MSARIPEQELPVELSPFAAVEAAYPTELGRVCEALQRGLPVMVEADKELTPFFYKCLRDRLKREGKQFLYLDGRAAQDPPPGMPAPPGRSPIWSMRSGSRANISFGGYQSGHSCLVLIVAAPDQPKPERPTPTP